MGGAATVAERAADTVALTAAVVAVARTRAAADVAAATPITMSPDTAVAVAIDMPQAGIGLKIPIKNRIDLSQLVIPIGIMVADLDHLNGKG